MLDAFDKALTAMAYAGAGLCFFAIVWAGFVLMAEGGDEREGGRAKSAVVLAVVGLVLALSAKGVAALLETRNHPVLSNHIEIRNLTKLKKLPDRTTRRRTETPPEEAIVPLETPESVRSRQPPSERRNGPPGPQASA